MFGLTYTALLLIACGVSAVIGIFIGSYFGWTLRALTEDPDIREVLDEEARTRRVPL